MTPLTSEKFKKMNDNVTSRHEIVDNLNSNNSKGYKEHTRSLFRCSDMTGIKYLWFLDLKVKTMRGSLSYTARDTATQTDRQTHTQLHTDTHTATQKDQQIHRPSQRARNSHTNRKT